MAEKAKLEEMSIFERLNSINVNEHVEKKNGLSYLSWAWAWSEIKKAYPEANYKIYENEQGWNYFTDGKTCWVKTGVVIHGQEHIEYLPVMDFRNKSIPADSVTSFDVNKAIQRSLTKACARHGLGMYIYAGEDLPEEEHKQAEEEKQKAEKKKLATQKDMLKKVLAYVNTLDKEVVSKQLAYYKVKSFNDLAYEQLESYIKTLEKKGIKVNE